VGVMGEGEVLVKCISGGYCLRSLKVYESVCFVLLGILRFILLPTFSNLVIPPRSGP
jgi:hypothetical protein